MDVRKPDRFSPFYGEGLGSPEPFANTIHQLYGERFLPWFETYNDPRAFERLLNDLPWSSIPTLSNLTDCQGTQDVESGRGQFFDRALLGLISSRIYAPQRFNDLKESYRKKISKSCWPEQWGNDIEPHLVYLETII